MIRKLTHWTDQSSSPLTVSHSVPVGGIERCHWHLGKCWLMIKTNWTRWPHSQWLQHALMKTPRLAELLGTHVYYACIYLCVCVCMFVCVNFCRPALTSCCKLLPVDLCVLLLSHNFTFLQSLPLGFPFVCMCTCMFEFYMCTCVCCVCLLLLLPEPDYFIQLTTIIKPVKISPMAESLCSFISYCKFYNTSVISLSALRLSEKQGRSVAIPVMPC